MSDRPKLACRFYQTVAGAEPVRTWLKSFAKDIRVQIGSDILKVQRMRPVSRPLVGSFGSGLYEVVTTVDGNEYRVLFCMVDSAMVLLHGFQKKTQKNGPARFGTRKKTPEGSQVMNKHIGSTLESLFDEEGERTELELLTLKKVITEQLKLTMKRLGYNNTQLAKKMHTERQQVIRLLDPENTSLTLDTLAKATSVLHLRIQLTPKVPTRTGPQAGKRAPLKAARVRRVARP